MCIQQTTGKTDTTDGKDRQIYSWRLQYPSARIQNNSTLTKRILKILTEHFTQQWENTQNSDEEIKENQNKRRDILLSCSRRMNIDVNSP